MESVEWLEISGLERMAAEALLLELRRLAKRHAIDIQDIRLEPQSGEERAPLS